ncbi:RNA-directed DNA polymerase, eukaryota, reverse transcriptase zinc-binding domain protein [Tanacetum coccineum]
MWGRYGLKEIVDNANGCWLFKLRYEEGMNNVVEMSPWMVNGKPLMVQKWNPNIGMEKTEHDKIPLWVKFTNVPMKAWSVEGLSGMASRRIEYARILIEISDEKGFKENVELQYMDKHNNVKGTKMVKVEYDWKPHICRHCVVFGHNWKQCAKRERTADEINEGLKPKPYKYKSESSNMDGTKSNMERIRMKRTNIKQWTKKKPNVESMGGNGKEKSFEEEFPKLHVKNTKERSTESLHGNERMKNKYSVLIDVEITRDWSQEMILYFKRAWEVDREKDRLDQEAGIERMVEGIVKDVLEDDSLATQNLVCDRAFGGWEWVSNSKFSENGCRIVVGWDNNAVNLMVVNMTRQDMFCLIENKYDTKRVYCSFVYATNTGNQKLKQLKTSLKNLSWRNEDVFGRVEYHEAVIDEKKLLFQKAKVEWLCEGDNNSAYFHKVIKGKNQRNIIVSILDKNRNMVEGDDVAKQFVEHYKEFLGQEKQVDDIPVTNNEIKTAMFDIGDNKDSGSNGYTSRFFKKAWHIVGEDICKAIKEFFKLGKLLGEINATIITLVPKIEHAKTVGDFRPISYCNVLYKCISKILTDRMKDGLNSLVNHNHCAFIKGRQIQDNIIIAQELLKGYNRNSGPKRCSLKIDIAKAYDTVNWEFLKKILILFGFHEKMVHWIVTCVTSASFSICVNGDIYGYFKGGRGLRQVLCHGDVVSVEVIKQSLNDFSRVSGLILNINKSTIFFGNISSNIQANILNILSFRVGKLHAKYLGIPLITKRLGMGDCTVKDIGRVFKGFFWFQGELTRGKAKVARKTLEKTAYGLNSLRDKVRPHIIHKIGNGQDTSVCYKQVAEMVHNGEWKWPWDWIDKFPELSQVFIPMFTDNRDKVLWKRNNGNYTDFSTKKAWEDMRSNGSELYWNKLVWFSQSILGHMFVVYMAVLGKLQTQDIIMVWNKDHNMKCALCNSCPDSHEHLFFKYDFSKKVWNEFNRRMMNKRCCYEWKEITRNLAKQYRDRSMDSVVGRIMFGACVYFVWQERNKRLFTNERRKVEEANKIINDCIKLKMMSLKVLKTAKCQPDDVCPIVPILCSSEDAAVVGIGLGNRIGNVVKVGCIFGQLLPMSDAIL